MGQATQKANRLCLQHRNSITSHKTQQYQRFLIDLSTKKNNLNTFFNLVNLESQSA